MKTLWKKILVLFLGFSNLAVLATVFHIYFDNHQSVFLFSMSEDEEDLREKIQKECKDYLEELVDGKRSSFICNVKLSQRHKGASYSLRTRLKVKKSDSGFDIEGQGRISSPTEHVTEADFCNDCDPLTDQVTENNFQETMNQIVDMAETIYSKAQASVQEAYDEHNKKDRERRMADLKERRCKGSWNEAKERYEEFDLEERLNCKMNKISSIELPLDVEEFYHEELKNELWQIALSEDDYILSDDMLERFNENPYRYSFSVRASTGLIDRYLSWKDHYEILDAQLEKANFVRSIKAEVDQTIQVMKPAQSQKDLYYLNKGFDGLLMQLNQATNSVPHLTKPSTDSPVNTSPPVAPVDPDRVREQVKDLY